jgi:hypothetical protein
LAIEGVFNRQLEAHRVAHNGSRMRAAYFEADLLPAIRARMRPLNLRWRRRRRILGVLRLSALPIRPHVLADNRFQVKRD